MESVFPTEMAWVLYIAGLLREFQIPGTLCEDLFSVFIYSKARNLCIHLVVSYVEVKVLPKGFFIRAFSYFLFLLRLSQS